MSATDTAVQEFGRLMGMPKLAFNEHGVVRLHFETSGDLSIERVGDLLTLYLARPFDRFRAGVLERALLLCGFDGDSGARPGAGLTRDGELVFWIRLDSLDSAGMQAALDLLRRLHDRAAAGNAKS
jgi:type III secretion system chaperone SycN